MGPRFTPIQGHLGSFAIMGVIGVHGDKERTVSTLMKEQSYCISTQCAGGKGGQGAAERSGQ